MATSGTATFDLDLNSLVEEAFERCGVELRSGYDLRTARRSLNLLTIEWANRGINLWTIEEGAVALTQGTTTYDLPADTIDLLDHVIRTGNGSTQSDINISRISVSTYASIPNKNVQGRPIQVWIDRQTDVPQINVWPVPDGDNYTLAYWRMRRIQDAGNGLNNQDIPFRMLPCLVAGLAYYLSLKIPEAMNRIEMLKLSYEEQWNLASSEDREKASLRLNSYAESRNIQWGWAPVGGSRATDSELTPNDLALNITLGTVTVVIDNSPFVFVSISESAIGAATDTTVRNTFATVDEVVASSVAVITGSSVAATIDETASGVEEASSTVETSALTFDSTNSTFDSTDNTFDEA